MQTQTPTQARAALAAAEQARDEIQRAYHEAKQERTTARQAGDIVVSDRWNARCGELNVQVRFAQSAVTEAREAINRANAELRSRLNNVASLSSQTTRVGQQLREAEAQVGSLTPELAHLQVALAEAQALLSEFQADEPIEQPSVAPEPAQPVERDVVWPMPARVVGAGRSDAEYYTATGERCDPWGRPLEGIEPTSAPAETSAKPDPMAAHSAPSLWE